MSLYVPREDSSLLQISVKDFAKGKVLDMGTGIGIQAITAASNRNVKSVLAVDIDKNAVEHAKNNLKNKKIRFAVSDLFSKVKGKFDTIIFNPPYLPADRYEPDIALIGGKKGHETIESFLDKANGHLSENGIILLLFSSITGKEKIEEIIGRNGFIFEEMGQKGVGLMDTLYVYLIRKSDLLRQLEKKGISDFKKLAKGHRGVIYIGKYAGRKVAVKIQRPDISVKSLQNEINCLKKINKYGIGPKLLFYSNDYFAYDFAEGIFIGDFIEKEKSRAKILKILRNVMLQCGKLDKLHLNKEEMQNPYKHVIVGKKITLIDFERCRYSREPKNVTQFCQYVISGKVSFFLNKKGIKIDKTKMIELARNYKSKFDEKSFRGIIKLIGV